MTLLSYSPQSRRIALSIKRIEGYRNFANKLWNASRFALSHLEGASVQAYGNTPAATALPNKWILSKLYTALDTAATGLNTYRLDDASGALYHFVWDEFCDWYLEAGQEFASKQRSKCGFRDPGSARPRNETALRALHPMMPHITEEIWQRIPKTDDAPISVMIARYPTSSKDGRKDAQAEKDFEDIKAFVGSIRTFDLSMTCLAAKRSRCTGTLLMGKSNR